MAGLPTGTVTFLFTDIEGSTRLLKDLGDRYAGVLAEYRRLLRTAVQERGGKEVDTQGDALFVAFQSARDALTAAVAAQRAIIAHTWPDGASLRVRMGLHTGEALAAETGYVGMDVHRAARICAAGHGGQILLSQTTRDIIEERPLEGLTLRNLGEHRLKDLGQAQHLYQVMMPNLPADFPPLWSLDVGSNNLPIQLTSFIGREREMKEIKGLLRSTRLLTLTGSGGCGKTRLAVQMAVDVLEAFRDGVWFVDLVRLSDPTIVPQAVASALGVREVPGRALLATLAEYLRDRHVLLVLDNCEHLVIACAQLADALLRSCPHLRILATSREAVGVEGELTFRVPSLSVPDLQRLPPLEQLIHHEAVRLFTERARWSLPTFAVTSQNAGAVAQVCVQLDGMPLALEMAAARVKVLTVEQIATRLDDRFRLLRAGSRTALPRHQTLRAAMDWSHDLLSERERVLFRRLSVFAGGFTLEAAEAICAGDGIGKNEVLEVLTQLVDKSLVGVEGENGKVRYRLLETVRQYGHDKLHESEESGRVLGRYRDFFLAFVERAEPELRGPEQEVWLHRLEVDYPNLRVALELSLEQEAEAGLRLASALWRFWEVRGRLSEGRGWLEEVLKRNGATSPAFRAKALKAAGFLARYLGDYAAAQSLLEESLSTYTELGDKQGIAVSLNNLGIVAGDQGHYERAAAFYTKSLAIARELGATDTIAMVLNNLAIVASHQRDFVVARSLYQESLILFRGLRDKRSIAVSAVNLGIIASRQGDFPIARSLLEESLAIQLELDDRGSICHELDAFGILAAAQMQAKRAARLFGAAETLREAIDAPLPPTERASHDSDLAEVCAALSEEAFATAWAEGRAMTLEQATEYALSDT